MKRNFFLVSILISTITASVHAQQLITTTKNDQPIAELKYNLTEDGTKYIKTTFLNQVWLRWNESNPGTTVNGDAKNHTVDIGLRRTRMQLYGQLTDHVFFYTQFGMNNFNYLSQASGNRKLTGIFS